MHMPDNLPMDKPVHRIMSKEIQPNAKHRKQAASFHRVLLNKELTNNGKLCVIQALMELVKKD